MPHLDRPTDWHWNIIHREAVFTLNSPSGSRRVSVIRPTKKPEPVQALMLLRRRPRGKNTRRECWIHFRRGQHTYSTSARNIAQPRESNNRQSGARKERRPELARPFALASPRLAFRPRVYIYRLLYGHCKIPVLFAPRSREIVKKEETGKRSREETSVRFGELPATGLPFILFYCSLLPEPELFTSRARDFFAAHEMFEGCLDDAAKSMLILFDFISFLMELRWI